MSTMSLTAVPVVYPAARCCTPLARLSLLFAVRRERARLVDLDDHTLDDIGISRAAAAREAARASWDLPANR